jgi:hypothetical protein
MRNAEKGRALLRSDRCAFCGANLRPDRVSIVEMAANAVCGIVLLTVLTLAGYIADKCVERIGHELFDQLVWHEPLDS